MIECIYPNKRAVNE